jgi:hypothetical protein
MSKRKIARIIFSADFQRLYMVNVQRARVQCKVNGLLAYEAIALLRGVKLPL